MWNNESINEVRINGSRVFIEDEEVKTVLSEAIQQHGYMSIEEAEQITLAIIEKEYTLPWILDFFIFLIF